MGFDESEVCFNVNCNLQNDLSITKLYNYYVDLLFTIFKVDLSFRDFDMLNSGNLSICIVEANYSILID